VHVSYELTEIDHLFDSENQRIIYRIIQEALTNIGKHAGADRVVIAVREEGELVRFRVEDNGRGFDLQQTYTLKTMEKGMGLAAMAERVRILGGNLDIASREGAGTTIIFTVPIFEIVPENAVS
jgi:signal transduction histidine kinase